MNPRPRTATVLCAAVLLVSACAGTDGPARDATPRDGGPRATGRTPGTTRGPGGSADAATPTTTPTAPRSGRALVYSRIDELTGRWAALGAEPGDEAAATRASLASAIAREVARDLDAVLDDVRTSDVPRFRRAAARGLGFIATRPEEVRAALEGVLDAPDPRLVVDALVSLARHADRATDTDRVLPLLRHADPAVRSNAGLTLARVFRVRTGVGEPAVADGAQAEFEAELMAALFDPDDGFVRGHAAQALGALGSDGAEDALLNGLRDGEAFVRLSAAHALARVGTRRAVSPLLDTLAMTVEGPMRQSLALALGAIAEREGRTPPLARLGTDAAAWRAWWER